MDLNEFLTGRMTPDECWDLIRNLPGDSALMAALASDPEWVSDEPPRPPTYAEFGPVVRALAGVYDLLALLNTQVASLGGAPPKIDPYPRPVDVGEKLRNARARDEWRVLNQMLTGGR